MLRTAVRGLPASMDWNMGMAGRRGIPSTGMLTVAAFVESALMLKKPVLLELTTMSPAAPTACAKAACTRIAGWLLGTW